MIAFKNFLKKDEVTRTKSLDDLNDYISTVEARSGTLDDGFLEAWVRLHLLQGTGLNDVVTLSCSLTG